VAHSFFWGYEWSGEVRITLPVAEVEDPLQDTRIHLTVYVPEHSSFAALFADLAGCGGML